MPENKKYRVGWERAFGWKPDKHGSDNPFTVLEDARDRVYSAYGIKTKVDNYAGKDNNASAE